MANRNSYVFPEETQHLDDQLEQAHSPLWSTRDWKDESLVRIVLFIIYPNFSLLKDTNLNFSRGLAQKLSIRLGKQFPQSKMVEINAHSLGSKFFSESGKLVARMFDNIENILEEEPDTFVCVFIDEAETLIAKREQSVHGNEPFDAMRAVNALLTALDRLRHRQNVVVLCTSNLITALVWDLFL